MLFFCEEQTSESHRVLILFYFKVVLSQNISRLGSRCAFGPVSKPQLGNFLTGLVTLLLLLCRVIRWW